MMNIAVRYNKYLFFCVCFAHEEVGVFAKAKLARSEFILEYS